VVEPQDFSHSSLLTAQAVADHLCVSLDTVYQSIPGRNYRCKLARPLPKPLRLGTRNLLRWRRDQIDQYIQSLMVPEPEATVVDLNSELKKSDPSPVIRRGRPRKQPIGAQGGAV